jgi:hypothetical protein
VDVVAIEIKTVSLRKNAINNFLVISILGRKLKL